MTGNSKTFATNMQNKTYASNMQSKTSRIGNNSRKGTLVETGIISMTDLERMKKYSNILSKEDEMNNKKILEDQKIFAQASAQVNNYTTLTTILFLFVLK